MVVGEVEFYGTEVVAVPVEHGRLESISRQRFGADPAVITSACVLLGGNVVQVVWYEPMVAADQDWQSFLTNNFAD